MKKCIELVISKNPFAPTFAGSESDLSTENNFRSLTITCIMYIVQFICKTSYCINSDSIIVPQYNTKLSSSTRLYLLRMKIFIHNLQGSLCFIFIENPQFLV